MKKLMAAIIAEWKLVVWVPLLPTLDRHLEHIAGGGLLVLIFLSFGAPWLMAAWLSTAVAFLIEFTTAVVKKNWKDSTFDFVQYQFHWPFYFASTGAIGLCCTALGFLIILYVGLLIKKW